MNKHNKRGYIYSYKVRHLEYVINYSFIRILRNLHNLCNLHRKPQVTRNFATLGVVEEVQSIWIDREIDRSETGRCLFPLLSFKGSWNVETLRTAKRRCC